MSASAARSFFLAADAFRINDFVAPHQNLSKIFRQGLAASEQINDENALSARYGDSGNDIGMDICLNERLRHRAPPHGFFDSAPA